MCKCFEVREYQYSICCGVVWLRITYTSYLYIFQNLILNNTYLIRYQSTLQTHKNDNQFWFSLAFRFVFRRMCKFVDLWIIWGVKMKNSWVERTIDRIPVSANIFSFWWIASFDFDIVMNIYDRFQWLPKMFLSLVIFFCCKHTRYICPVHWGQQQ